MTYEINENKWKKQMPKTFQFWVGGQNYQKLIIWFLPVQIKTGECPIKSDEKEAWRENCKDCECPSLNELEKAQREQAERPRCFLRPKMVGLDYWLRENVCQNSQ